MGITFQIDGEDAAEIMMQLRALLSELSPRAEVVPFTSRTAAPARDETEQAPASAPEPSLAKGMTVVQLKAGMRLKETATTSVGGGERVAAGEYVTCDGDLWLVEATYRGSLIGVNESGQADLLKAEACTKTEPRTEATTADASEASEASDDPAEAPASAEPAAPTPAATPSGEAVTPDVANRLRDLATDKVSDGKLAVADVFKALQSYGVSNIDGLSAAQAVEFEKWLTADSAAGTTFGF